MSLFSTSLQITFILLLYIRACKNNKQQLSNKPTSFFRIDDMTLEVFHLLCAYFITSAPCGLTDLQEKWFLQNLSIKSSIPESQWPGNHNACLHFWDLAPHTCSLNWTAELVSLEGMGEKPEARVCLWMEAFCSNEGEGISVLCLGKMCELLQLIFLWWDRPQEQVLPSQSAFSPEITVLLVVCIFNRTSAFRAIPITHVGGKKNHIFQARYGITFSLMLAKDDSFIRMIRYQRSLACVSVSPHTETHTY